MKGTVKMFDTARGYGFIKGDDGQDAFVHYSQIEGEGYRSLTEGQRVVYSTIQEVRGIRAVAVSIEI